LIKVILQTVFFGLSDLYGELHRYSAFNRALRFIGAETVPVHGQSRIREGLVSLFALDVPLQSSAVVNLACRLSRRQPLNFNLEADYRSSSTLRVAGSRVGGWQATPVHR